MSRSSIEQALTGLIPTINGPLPPELVELALSLLARSRSVATSLKPDEEIARPYACAQLACERLKKRLNLPSISPRPPCPPRIYKKLYSYLTSALPAPTTPQEPQTPRKSTASAPQSARNTPKTPLSSRRTPRSSRKDEHTDGEPPEWTMASIRTLAKAFNYPSAAPHVFAGMESILPLLTRMSAALPDTPSKRPRRSAAAQSSTVVNNGKILSLMVVIFLYVFTRMKDEDITPEVYGEWRERAVNTILKMPAAKDATHDDLSQGTEQLMPMAQEEGWLQMEWFTNVTPLGEAEEMEGVEMTESAAVPVVAKRKGSKTQGSEYIGLGTMMQDATDYLSDQQRADYKMWKAGILVRLQEIEAE